MHRDPTTVREEEELGIALQLMLWGRIRHLPVVEGGRLVGILSDRDVLRHRGEEAWRVAGRVRDAMTRDVKVVGPDEPLEDAAALMTVAHIDSLPVLEDGQLVGILTTADLMALMARCEVEPRAPTAETVMTADPATARADEYLLDAASRMFHLNVRHLPVVDQSKRVIGILSDRDLRLAVGNPLSDVREQMRVADAMTGGAWTVQPDAPLSDVVDILVDDRVGAVPVVDDDGLLLGIVSYLDVLRATVSTQSERPRHAPTPTTPRSRAR